MPRPSVPVLAGLTLAVLAVACNGAAPSSGAVEVSGVDYRFDGVPASLAAGTSLTFRNVGSEVHEMVVVRRNEDVTTSFEEILRHGREAAQTQVTVLGAAVAPPGGVASEAIALDRPGLYALVCFIPTGTKPGASGAPTGPPHFTQGMIHEIVVGGERS